MQIAFTLNRIHTGLNFFHFDYGHPVLNGENEFHADTKVRGSGGGIESKANTFFDNNLGENRFLQTGTWLTGSGNIFAYDVKSMNEIVDRNATVTGNTSNGHRIVDQKGLLSSGTNTAERNNIGWRTNGFLVAIAILSDINSLNVSLIFGNNASVLLRQNIQGGNNISETQLTNGTCTFAIQNRFSTKNLPSTWPQSGFTSDTGFGQIVVGEGDPAPLQYITGITLNITRFSISSTNATVVNSLILLQRANWALPLN